MAIELSKEQIKDVLPSIQRFMIEEFDVKLGDMRASFILDYFLTEIAPIAYNKGVKDAERYFMEKAENLTGTCYEQELNYWTKKKMK